MNLEKKIRLMEQSAKARILTAKADFLELKLNRMKHLPNSSVDRVAFEGELDRQLAALKHQLLDQWPH